LDPNTLPYYLAASVLCAVLLQVRVRDHLALR